MRQLILIFCSFACVIDFILTANCMNYHERKGKNSNLVLELLECIEKFKKIQETEEHSEYQRLMIKSLMDRLKNMHMNNLRLR